MSCNNYKPHLHIYSEDGATRDAAEGFMQFFSGRDTRQFQSFTASGYSSVRQMLEVDAKLANFSNRRIVCVIDFDNTPERFDELKNCVAIEVRDRVYVVGCAEEIETAKRMLNFQGHDDDFGRRLASQNESDWNAPCLRASKTEMQRLLKDLRSNEIKICPP